MHEESKDGADLDGQDAKAGERPLGTLMGGEPPKPLVTPPVIQFCNAAPNPEEAGNPVNITCMIMDDLGVVAAWVEVTDPDGIVIGNFSMAFDGMLWYYESPYFKAGLYTYTVTAEDQEGQLGWDDGMASFNFLIEDTIPPSVANETASPSPQEIGQNVNISCNVTDNGLVEEAWVEVYDPSMIPLGNFS
ncbi:MAG: hypothetical protein KAW09_11805, partial [Thermoplasmata archaeon]|nr:hypothetical protein [Thermoplasmata archaeon]